MSLDAFSKKINFFLEDVLNQFRGKFSTYGGALDEKGQIVDPLSTEAVKWSMMGACIKVASENKHATIIVKMAVNELENIIKAATDNQFDLKLFEVAEKTEQQAVDLIQSIIEFNPEEV